MFEVTEHCRLCGGDRAPEELFTVRIPHLARPMPACASCRIDFETGGRRLTPFEPGFRVDRGLRWPAASIDDARVFAATHLDVETIDALGASLREAHEVARAWREGPDDDPAALARALVAAIVSGDELGPIEELERLTDRARSDDLSILLAIYAHALGAPRLGERDPRPAEPLIRVARRTYVLEAPGTATEERGARLVTLSVLLELACGDPRDAEAKLEKALRSAGQREAARDPRLHLAKAFLLLEAGNASGCDRALAAARKWADAEGWTEERAIVLHDEYARALATKSWERARDALKGYVRARPDDRRAHLDLAHTYMRCSLDPVAREVLAVALDDEARRSIRVYHETHPEDLDGLVLYATCLARLGETRAAWALLRDHVIDVARDESLDDGDQATQILRAEALHLAGLCAEREGKDDRALELLAASWELVADSACRRNLMTLLHARASEVIEAMASEQLGELEELLARHRDALIAEFEPFGVHLALGFLSRELGARFGTMARFGPDWVDRAVPADAASGYLKAALALSQRRLPEALEADAHARGCGGGPAPIRLILLFLEKLEGWSKEGVLRFIDRAQPPEGSDDATDDPSAGPP